MNIIIKNLGPIKKFEYDLTKEIIVTYGNNNIGKSYSMQIVYLLLKNLLSISPYQSMRYFRINYGFSSLYDYPIDDYRKYLAEFQASNNQQLDMTDYIKKEFYNKINRMLTESLINSCHNTFGNFEKTLKSNPTIQVKFDKYNFEIDLSKSKITGSVTMLPVNIKKTNKLYHKSRLSNTHYDIYMDSDIDNPIKLLIDEIEKLVREFFIQIQSKYDNVYFLPASRSGIYSGMSAFSSIIAELSKSKSFLTKKIELPGISEPISDYFITLSNINVKLRREDKIKPYYNQIEENILKGSVTFDKNKNTLLYSPQNMDAQFEMTEVSSMVSEIAPIVAFLKYILNDNTKNPTQPRKPSILFIEEPEAHLHPLNQVNLINIFSQLNKVGIKLIISSHSNYVFNKLNNLILSKQLNYKDYLPIVLIQENGKSISKMLEIDELGVSDDNFSDVSSLLYEEREEIIKKLTEEDLT